MTDNQFTQNHEEFSLAKELSRKIFHLLLLLIPFGYSIFGKIMMLKIIFPLMLIILFVDYLRHKNEIIKNCFNKVFSAILRKKESEENKFCGASFAFVAAFLIILFAKKEIAIISFLILAICDASASLIGKSIKSKPFFDKSLAGSIAFYLSGVLIVIICGSAFNLGLLFYIFAFISLFITTIVEARPNLVKIDDNFSVPFAFAVSMTFFDLIWSII